MNEHLNSLSEKYERRHADAGFRPAAEFKAEFFRKAGQLPERRKFRLVKIYPWISAVAAMAIITMVIFFYHRPASAPATSLMAEARRMFEPDGLGVALVNGELLTFERTEKNSAESLFEIDLNPGGVGQSVKIQFACASGDLVKIDTKQLNGEFWICKVDKKLFAMESDCVVKIAGGEEVRLAGFAPVAMNGTQSEKINHITITRKVMPL
jgi:hypothetical protein